MFGYLFSNKEYKYKNKRMNSSIFADILVALHDHEIVTKEDAIKDVRFYHQKYGGDCTRTNWNAIFQAAVKNVLNGFILQMDNNTYRLSYASADGLVDDMEYDDLGLSERISCDIVIGSGKGAVYVYYYDIHKEHFIKEGYNVWPCKVGMSLTNPMNRIFSQIGTASPEWPHAALIIYTDKPKELETMLHAVLKIQGTQIKNGPCREWFMTNPETVQDLYERMLG